MLPDRANLLCLLKILEEYSDSEHILPMREIIGKMKSIYDIDIARRAVYGAIELLKQIGYDISTYACLRDLSSWYYPVSRIAVYPPVLLYRTHRNRHCRAKATGIETPKRLALDPSEC